VRATGRDATIRGVSVQKPYVDAILSGEKTEEYRTWRIAPGPLVIQVSRTGCAAGGVLAALVDVTGCEGDEGDWAWQLANVRPLVRVPFKGQAKVFRVPRTLVQLASGAPLDAPPAIARSTGADLARAPRPSWRGRPISMYVGGAIGAMIMGGRAESREGDPLIVEGMRAPWVFVSQRAYGRFEKAEPCCK
jgi:hypothetical protein